MCAPMLFHHRASDATNMSSPVWMVERRDPPGGLAGAGALFRRTVGGGSVHFVAAGEAPWHLRAAAALDPAGTPTTHRQYQRSSRARVYGSTRLSPEHSEGRLRQ